MRPYWWKKRWNAWINRRERKQRKTVLRSYPQIVYVEPTNICTLRCALCPSGQRKIRPVGKMSMETFRLVLDTLGPWAREVHLYNWGEPLLHEGLPEMISYAKRYGVVVWVSTNLNNLDEKMARGLVDARLDHLNASIDGVTQETYAAYRIGGDIERVLENLRMLCAIKREKRSPWPRIRWQFLVHRKNEAELPKARAMAKELGVEFGAKRIRIGLSEFDSESASRLAESDQQWVPQDSKYNRYAKPKRRPICKPLWDRTVINWQGAVAPCCQVYKAEHHFRTEFDADFFRSVWNGPEYVAARRLFADGDESEAERLGLVCVPCLRLGNLV